MSRKKPNPAPSPYLLLQQDAPVKWEQWSAETLSTAQKQDKSILLSLGYATCHPCETMNQETFADAEIAARINENFIPVLVDREARPDLDQIYQAAANLMGHPGGWPLNIFLTPTGFPYFVTGYMPPSDRQGQAGFTKALDEATTRWKDQREQTEKTADNLQKQLEALYNREARRTPENISLDLAALRIGQRYDIFLGGFAGQMKYPSVPLLEVMTRAYLRSATPQFLQLASGTLEHILLAGLYDHVGGGFFRYTSDENWEHPNFEKTLGESALLLDYITLFWQFNRNDLCRLRAAETIDWLLREMKLDGGFASGLGAGGEEGQFYLWSEAEIDAALAGTFSQRFKTVYNVTHDGNLKGKNVLHRRPTRARLTLSQADDALITKQRSLLLAARDKRARPRRSETLLADANGLVIAALAHAGMAFERADWVAAAIAAFDHVVKTLGDGDRLYHSWTGGNRGTLSFADDYAQMARAALVLWEATGESRFLDAAKMWVATLDAQFWNTEKGGYFLAPHDSEPPVVRVRTIYDLPTPSANGTMVGLLARLALVTSDVSYRQRAEEILTGFVDEINRAYIPSGAALNGLETLGTGFQIVVVGPRNHPKTRELLKAIWGRALPNRLVQMVESGVGLPSGHPAFGKTMHNGQPTVYLCQRDTCSQPVTSAVTLSQALTLPQQRAATA